MLGHEKVGTKYLAPSWEPSWMSQVMSG